MSDNGMGVRSSEPVALGTNITIFIQAHGVEGAFNAEGQVVRCEHANGTYWLGLRFNQRAAA